MGLALRAIEKIGKSPSKTPTTDEVFLAIQNNHDLMYDYLIDVEKRGVATVNREIGKDTKAILGLNNADTRGNHPVSTLIQSYQELK